MGAKLSKDWYFADGSRTFGPFEIEELTARIIKKKDAASTLVWREGMADWTLARDVREIRFPASPPPLPQTHTWEPAPTVSDGARRRNSQPWQTIGVIVVAIISFSLARTIGGDFWIPLLLLAVSFWLTTKTSLQQCLRPTFSAALAHTLWIALGATILLFLESGKHSAQAVELLPDLVIMSAIVAWLYFQQSKFSLFGLIAYEIISLGINIYTFSNHPNPRFAMIMHIGIRLFIIGSSIYAINKLNNQTRAGDDQLG